MNTFNYYPVTQKALRMENVLHFLPLSRWFDHVLFTIHTERVYKFCDFQKRCKRAVKGLGLRQLQIWAAERCHWKRFDSGEQRCCSGTENSRITTCAAIWLQRNFEKSKNVYYHWWQSTCRRYKGAWYNEDNYKQICNIEQRFGFVTIRQRQSFI